MKKNPPNKNIIFLLFLIFMLTGCSDLVEIQDRDFVLALGISLKDNQYQLTFALPDLSALTQENKDGENENDQARTYEGGSLAEIEDLYNMGSNKRLDFRHLEVLILDEAISSSEEKLPDLFEYIENNYQLSRDVRVFYYPGDVKKLLETKGKMGGSIGDYLEKLENNNQRKKNLSSVTIGNLMDSLSQKRGIVVPVIELKEDKLEVNGGAIFQNSVYVKKLTENEQNIYHIIRDKGKEFNFRTQDNLVFKLKDFKSKTQYSYNNSIPKIKLIIKGTAEVLSEPGGKGGDHRSEINNYFKTSVLNQINTCFKEDKIDYVNFYEGSSIKSRAIWLAYRNRLKDFINDVVFDVDVDIKVQ